MIEYFNIPPAALIHTPVSKKLFADKVPLSAAEKRLLREDIDSITMRGLLQTRTIGIATYTDEEHCYDQIIIAEVTVRNPVKVSAIATMIQKAFPVPMFLIAHHQDSYCVNWCIKRINQSDASKRVIEEQRITRFFAIDGNDAIATEWLRSLDITRFHCGSLKELFEELASKLLMLSASDEAGTFIESGIHKIELYRSLLEQLAVNRTEQKRVSAELKTETQFNMQLKLTSKLKELEILEKELKERMNNA